MDEMDMGKLPRVLLKISGETLSGEGNFGFDFDPIEYLAHEIATASEFCQLAIVVGGGNIFRGTEHGLALKMIDERGKPEPDADYAGMVATIINGLVLRNVLKRWNFSIRLMSSLPINKIAEPYIALRAMRHLEKNEERAGQRRIVVIVAGMGEPFVSTDYAMVHRGCEIKAEMILKGTKVRGIFNKDPHRHDNVEFLPVLSFDNFILRDPGRILDMGAVQLAKDRRCPIHVFNIFEQGNLSRAVQGENVGSLVTSEDKILTA